MVNLDETKGLIKKISHLGSSLRPENVRTTNKRIGPESGVWGFSYPLTSYLRHNRKNMIL